MSIRYTRDQRDAIEEDEGNLLILACAGSGKTEVVSRRIARLVKHGTSKESIVAFTFTERAAHELKLRIRKHLGALVPEQPALGDMYVGTIHSFCLQILKEIDPAYRNYEVMDEARQAALIATNFSYYADSDTGLGLDRLQVKSRSGGYWNTVSTFVRTLSIIYQNNLSIDSLEDEDLRFAASRYQQLAYSSPNFFFDFDRIIGELIRELNDDPSHLHRLRERFSHVIVDEYQDVDSRQEELIQLLSEKGRSIWVTAVGDDDQSIYGWRGARIENIKTFEHRYPDVRKISLTSNFRSTHAIVEIANQAIRQLSQGVRIEKEMTARRYDPDGDDFVERMALDGEIQLRTFASDRSEADWVAERIEQLRGTVLMEPETGEAGRGLDYGDCAILLRSVRSKGQIFSTVLEERGIPAVVRGTGGLFEHDEVLVVYAIFCLLARSKCHIQTDGQYHKLRERETRELVRSRINRLRTRGDLPNAWPSRILEWVARKREELDRRRLEKSERGHLARRIYPQAIYHEVLSVIGIADEDTDWRNDVMYNLGRLSDLITQFEAVHQWVTPQSLRSLTTYLGGWAADQVDEGGVSESGVLNAVQIMTVHRSKGLEWPAVFIPQVTSYHFPSSLRNRPPDTFLTGQDVDLSQYAGGDEGERRLWYVALTRCRRFLNISSQDRHRKRPTDYFQEIQHDRVQRDGPIPSFEKTEPAPPADIELMPTTYSDLKYFWRCPYEYELRSLMGFSPGVTEQYGYGEQIHNVLTEVHQRAASGESLSAAAVLQLVDERFHLRYTRDEPLENLRKAAKRSVARYIARYPNLKDYVLDAEKAFEFVDQGALISGSIDLLEKREAIEGERDRVPVAVVDFKTHDWDEIEDFHLAREQVAQQLQLYAVAAQRALNFRAEEARAHFLSPNGPSDRLSELGAREVVSVDVSPEACRKRRQTVGDAVRRIKDLMRHGGKFPKEGIENGQCPHCDYRMICAGYGRWEEMDRVTPRPGSLEEEREQEVNAIAEEVDARSKS